ncbi:DUF4352 domain-containing protein [Guptibacillus hwajinpoensis]|uniref:DUF4352 domain-containing protein n=1 Tax=Guptibacillus hwajinpoensis TaxID=208199 RepID=UPI001CFC8CA4|nr:DUF4352 domain-containing protein [Pseudalkalibacillus hwajinpoensis]WLR61540.1 DUF4352 domain-containing protein [Pseudalkalibacillus hwajinpoensis]
MAKLVNCKACEKEIAKGVKKCPNCGKDQRGFIMRHKIISFVGALVILGGISGALGGDSEEASKEVSGETTEVKKEEAKAFNLNDVIGLKRSEVTITNFEQRDEVGTKQASDGGTFVAIQYTIKNISEEPIGAFSFPTVSLTNEKGTKFDSDIDASANYAVETGVDNSKILSDLNPDISVTDTVVFEISKEKFESGNWFILVDGKHKVALK